jgi:hypothetical protein
MVVCSNDRKVHKVNSGTEHITRQGRMNQHTQVMPKLTCWLTLKFGPLPPKRRPCTLLTILLIHAQETAVSWAMAQCKESKIQECKDNNKPP